jgi:maltodextrin utilization protein YvdJ
MRKIKDWIDQNLATIYAFVMAYIVFLILLYASIIAGVFLGLKIAS